MFVVYDIVYLIYIQIKQNVPHLGKIGAYTSARTRLELFFSVVAGVVMGGHR